MSSIALKVEVNPEDLQQLVKEAVAEVLQELERSPIGVDGRLAYSEPEAAELLGLKRHQLRDERLKGRIQSTRVAGKAWYERSALLDYLRRNRQEGVR